mmetsp:Transcript_29333/g.58210  ORF Transcript_29333/g.58210 Transcript_29333/m.58210 type:complete len:89 (+) Transcript_29333:99-365(+)
MEVAKIFLSPVTKLTRNKRHRVRSIIASSPRLRSRRCHAPTSLRHIRTGALKSCTEWIMVPIELDAPRKETAGSRSRRATLPVVASLV